MKIITTFVSSLDGKITQWHDGKASLWSSPEELTYFRDIISHHTVLVMGSNTFQQEKPKPEKERLRIVMTRHPEEYSEFHLENQLEFTNASPEVLVSLLEKRGYTTMLFLGGPTLTSLFFKKNLIDEVWISFEPKIFGKGRSFVIEEEMDISLSLFDSRQLNSNGTYVLKYRVHTR